MRPLPSYIIPFLIFSFSLILRYLFISKGPYDVEALNLAIRSVDLLEHHHLEMQTGLGYPLLVILGSFFVGFLRFFGCDDPVVAANFISVVLGAFNILLIYLFVKKIFTERCAVLSAILLSFNPLFLGLSTYASSHMPAIFFFLLGLLSLFSYRHTARFRDILLTGFYWGCFGATRIVDWGLLLPAMIFIHQKWTKPSLKEFLGFWAFTILVVFAFYSPFFFQETRAQHSDFISRFWHSALLDNFLGLISPNLFKGFGFLTQSLSLGGLLLALIGLAALYRANKEIGTLLILWIAIPFMFYGNLRMTVTARYFVVTIPALVIAIGFVLSRWAELFPSLKKIIYTGLIIFVIFLSMRVFPLIKIHHDQAILPEFCQWACQMTKPGAVIISAEEHRFIEHYTSCQTLVRPMSMNPIDSQSLLEFKNQVDSLLDQGVPLYITTAGLFAYDKNGNFSNFFLENYEGYFVGEHLYEDWHRHILQPQIFSFELYQIEKKTSHASNEMR
ncbi:MAG: glycosyltransferase family 39 protein [Candidatus Omnitrophica bacterium]|nr:glycosyltransferase family 39 protein [Candidatus Omnitrophota bacterium]